MGQNISGGMVAVCVYPESPYKTPGANGTRLPFATFGLNNQQPRNKSAILSGYYGESRGILGLKGVSGSITTEAGPEDIGIWLKHLIGAPVSATAGSANKHTFLVGKDTADIPLGMSFEQDFGTALASATHRVLRYIGCRLNKGTFNFNTSGFIGCSFDVLGADVVPDDAPLDATPDDLGHTSWSITDVGIVLSAGSTIEVCLNSLQLNFNNDLDPDLYCISAGGVRDDLARGIVGCDGQLVGLFDSDALLKQTMADTDASLVVTCMRGTGDGTAGNEKLVLTVPALTFSPGSVPVNGPKGLRVTANFTAHRTTGEIGLKAELWNMQTAIP